MSTPHVSRYELETAAFQAMDNSFDTEVAEDLGLTTPENATRQIESGKQVGALLMAASATVEKDTILTDDFGGFTHGANHRAQAEAMKNPRQVEINRRGADAARAIYQANKER